jgi:YidC/Oxa1 family membrane protein insertase
MDRNQAIGFTLIMGLLFLYFYLSKSTQKLNPDLPKPTVQSPKQAEKPQIQPPDSVSLTKQYGDFASFAQGQASEPVLENKDVRITFSSQGGKVKSVLLKNYKTYAGQPLVLLDDKQSKITEQLPVSQGNVELSGLYFSEEQSKKGDTSVLTFKLRLANNQSVEKTYRLAPSGFLLDYQLRTPGMTLSNQPMQIHWTDAFRNVEKDIKQTREKSTVTFYTEEKEFDDLSETSKDLQEKNLDPLAKIKWVAFKQKFFLTALIARHTFGGATVRSEVNEADTSVVKTFSADFQVPAADVKAGKADFQFFFGPNDYQVVREVADGFRKNVYLGIPVISGISRFVIVPVFRFLETFIHNYGLLIVVLVLVVKLILLPLNYRSYISSAKMRVMGQLPEMVEVREKFKDKPQELQQETLKMYQQVGVNPLSGCIPVLLQMPILFSLFQLFPNLIEFRQKTFLWAEDLSTYDSVLNLPFSIPFGYGSHVSLFTILMTASTLVYTYFTNQLTPTTNNAQQPFDPKIIAYTTPLIFMFVLNSFPAGLSFYYFVSNFVSVAQQLIIRRFVDEKKIEAILQANKIKNKDKPKSKFSQRIEEAMKTAEEQRKRPGDDKRKK